MKLFHTPQSEEKTREYIRALEHLIIKHSHQETRSCLNCEVECECGSRNCTCKCSPDCEMVPEKMSSDRNFPIEQGIIPLVYSFNRLRVIQPYWSCAGHVRNGELLRVPQIWFYSDSLIHVKMLYDYLSRLKARRTIIHHWNICITHTDKLWDSGFCIKPDIEHIKQPKLEWLQKDVCIIADHLVDNIKKMAEEYIGRLKQGLKDSAMPTKGLEGKGMAENRQQQDG